jgi:hypothetical protein
MISVNEKSETPIIIDKRKVCIDTYLALSWFKETRFIYIDETSFNKQINGIMCWSEKGKP